MPQLLVRRGLAVVIAALTIAAVASTQMVGSPVAGHLATTRTVSATSGSGAATTSAPAVVVDAGGASTTTVVASSGGSTAKAPGARTSPTVAAGGSAAAAASAQPDAGLGAPGDPGPAAAPSDGTFQYKVAGLVAGYGQPSGSGTRDVPMTVKTTSKTGDEVHQQMTVKTDKGSGTSFVVWRADTVIVDKIEGSDGTNDASCDWQPDRVLLNLPLAVGTTWTIDTTCAITTARGAATTKLKGTAKVTEVARMKVADDVVDTWVIDEATHSTTAVGTKTFEVDRTSRQWFAPKAGLVAREVTHTKGVDKNGKPYDIPGVRTLQSLRPEGGS